MNSSIKSKVTEQLAVTQAHSQTADLIYSICLFDGDNAYHAYCTGYSLNCQSWSLGRGSLRQYEVNVK